MINAYPELLLFSKERGRYPYSYRLYFVTKETVGDEYPIIHRFLAFTPKLFNELTLGTVYDISAHKLFIKSASPIAAYNLSDDEYYHLADQRDLLFLGDREARHIELTAEDYDPRDSYYSFENTKRLIEYRPPFFHRAFQAFIRIVLYSLAILIPMLLYILFVYSLATLVPEEAVHSGAIFAVPIAATFSLPFAVWLMMLIYLVAETLLLNVEYFRYEVLRRYTLRWGGMRKNCRIEPSTIKYLKRSGIIVAALFAVGMIAAFLLI